MIEVPSAEALVYARVGEQWRGRQRGPQQDHPWVVRIVKRGAASVAFEVIKGPGRSKGSRHQMRIDCFLVCFVPQPLRCRQATRRTRSLNQRAARHQFVPIRAAS